jgi:peptidoglycan/LPS O-acetylase OafA/YrhL
MNKKLAIAAAVLAAFAFTCQSADAGGRKHHVDKRIAVVAIGVGAASTAAFFAINDWRWRGWNNSSGISRWGAWGLTTVGCAALSPIVATVVVNRPLTQREAHVLLGSCVIPIVGGWLVNQAYEAHPEWEPERAAWKEKHRTKM